VLDPASVFYYYHWKRYPGWAVLAAITLNVLALATLFRLGAYLARRSPRPLVRSLMHAAFLVAVLFALNSIRLQLDSLLVSSLLQRLGRAGLVVLLLLLGVVAVYLLRRFPLRRLSRFAQTLVLILSPLVLFNFAQGFWLTLQYASMLSDKPTASMLPPKSPNRARVLWLIFDEMDERIAFPEGAPRVSLPELERLRAESVYATNAYPPAGETLLSMPAYITGRLVSKAKQLRPDELELRFTDSDERVFWSKYPNVFSRARSLGYNTALVGWFHPYCRLLSESLTTCSWQTGMAVTDDEKLTVVQNMLFQLRTLVLSLPFWKRVESTQQLDDLLFRNRARRNFKASFIARHQAIRAEALKTITRPELELTMIHLAVPHPPGIYNRRTGRFSTEPESSYLDNLALTDKTFGELRRTLEDARLWDSTTIVVTSDHWLRFDTLKSLAHWRSPEDQALVGLNSHRVPFILKLAGHTEGFRYDSTFNTVVTHDLILALLRGELNNPQQIVRWLDEHKSK
jgi:hypothetical protein